MNTHQKHILQQLQRDILPLQGYKASLHPGNSISLGPINEAFPGNVFPLGAVHEFISYTQEDAAATYGFVMAATAKISHQNGLTLWITSSRLVFPAGLAVFGICPGNLIFLNLQKETDILWAMEEALKCDGLCAIVCETPNISFTASRRFQLAVEQSGATGFILRQNPKNLSVTATIARWKISSLKSEQVNELPGLGFPRWNVELLKIRNGRLGHWQVEFSEKQFRGIDHQTTHIEQSQHKKAG